MFAIWKIERISGMEMRLGGQTAWLLSLETMIGGTGRC